MGYDIGGAAADMGFGAANSAIGAGLGILMAKANDRRQLKQQTKLQALQMGGAKEMTDYQKAADLKMWRDTSYPAQMEMLKRAGLNPGLMYGMGGGGGQTTGGSGAMPSGGNAPAGGGEIGMGMQMGMQMQLLKAQKDNIEADTENKKASARGTTATAEGQGLANALTAWLQGTDTEGNQIGADMGKSVRGQEEIQNIHKTKAETKFKLDENEREALKNSAVLNEIGAKIAQMAQTTKNEGEIYKNLQKQGLLLDAEIEWNKLDISGGNVGKFLMNIIKMAVKPR